jgi:CheY-like chemotaxis protein
MAKLVVMEDEPDISMLVEATLQFDGHQVQIAANGHDGIELIRRHHPEIIILDVQMPDMSGYDVLKILKNDSVLCQIPVLLFSAHNRPEDIERGRDLGAAGFLNKPFDPKDLLEQLNTEIEKLS